MSTYGPFHTVGPEGVRFRPGVQHPEHPEAAGPGIWFAFRGDRLLVQVEGERTALPEWANLAELGLTDRAGHYLGRLGESDCYAVDLDSFEKTSDQLTFEGLRQLFGRLPDPHFSLAGRAVQIIEWDRTHRFCGRCGSLTEPLAHERARRCPHCGLQSFPRLSPAVIMLVERGDEILLAQGTRFPNAFYSVLAGFVEPGESLEEAVIREVHEEVGLEITDLRYFGSQPWPFPNSLMIAFTTTYAGGEIVIEPSEIATAAWFPKRALPERLPGGLSIARRLIDWAAGRV